MLAEQESNYVMIPSSRITRDNYWCSSDVIFIDEISKLFKQWIHRKETPHGNECDSATTIGTVTQCNNSSNTISSSRDDNCTTNMEAMCNLKDDNNNSGSIISGDHRNASQQNNENCSDIPKKIHFIWLGSEIPINFNILISQWRVMHPSWEVKIWKDEGEERTVL